MQLALWHPKSRRQISVLPKNQFDHRLHTTVSQELQKQIIAAIECKYFASLYDGDFGASAFALLQHLNGTYAIIAPDDIERNRQQLSFIIKSDQCEWCFEQIQCIDDHV
jgi:hypothetical protein